MSIAKVAYQDGAGNVTEARRSDSYSPRGVELAVLREALQRAAIEIKGVHNAVALAGNIVYFVIALHGIRYKQPVAYPYCVKWSVISGQIRIGERLQRECRGREIGGRLISSGGIAGSMRAPCSDNRPSRNVRSSK